MKTTTHNPSIPIEEQHYKKRFLVRKLQEQEAAQEIALQKLLHNASHTDTPQPSSSGHINRPT
jgi:hypothetical protein